METRYSQVAREFFLDRETMQFCHLDELENGAEVEVPFPLWDYGNGSSKSVKAKSGNTVLMHYAETLNLNKCCIRLHNDCIHTDISWESKKDTKMLMMSCRVQDSTNYSTMTRVDYSYQFQYNQKVDFASSLIYLDDVDGGSFARLFELGRYGKSAYSMQLHFGLAPEQYRVIYKGKNIGESYAVVIGTWVVFLNDELKFDTIALLRGANSFTLLIDQFLYTENPYVVKVKTFIG